ncbi:MAG: hypothetical protein EZS28_039229, partial [Streblomastix strix]
KATRDLLRPSLLDKKNDEFLQAIKHTEPDTLKIFYAPLLAYNEFAQPYFIDEVSETIMIGDIDEHCFDNKNYYWKFCLRKEGDYTVNLYGLNSTLTCDGKERAKKELEGNHLTFLPKPAYNIQTYSNEINISMMHHPLDWLIDEDHACTIFDDRFKLQFFGHMHIQSSHSDKAVRIFSGAFQPEKEADMMDYPPVYNIIELNVDGTMMIVKLESRKWDGAYFIKYEEESKTMSISLVAPDNWSEITQEESKKEPMIIEHIMTPINEINYMFINSDKQREIIEKLIPGTFDDERSDRANCLIFLKAVKEKSLYQQLLKELNKQNGNYFKGNAQQRISHPFPKGFDIKAFISYEQFSEDVKLPPIVYKILSEYVVYMLIMNADNQFDDTDKMIYSLIVRNMMVIRKNSYNQLLAPAFMLSLYPFSESYRKDENRIEKCSDKQIVPDIFLYNNFEEMGLTLDEDRFDEIKQLAQQATKLEYQELIRDIQSKGIDDPFVLAYYAANILAITPEWKYVDANPVKTLMNIFPADRKNIKLKNIKVKLMDSEWRVTILRP